MLLSSLYLDHHAVWRTNGKAGNPDKDWTDATELLLQWEQYPEKAAAFKEGRCFGTVKCSDDLYKLMVYEMSLPDPRMASHPSEYGGSVKTVVNNVIFKAHPKVTPKNAKEIKVPVAAKDNNAGKKEITQFMKYCRDSCWKAKLERKRIRDQRNAAKKKKKEKLKKQKKNHNQNGNEDLDLDLSQNHNGNEADLDLSFSGDESFVDSGEDNDEDEKQEKENDMDVDTPNSPQNEATNSRQRSPNGTTNIAIGYTVDNVHANYNRKRKANIVDIDIDNSENENDVVVNMPSSPPKKKRKLTRNMDRPSQTDNNNDNGNNNTIQPPPLSPDPTTSTSSKNKNKGGKSKNKYKKPYTTMTPPSPAKITETATKKGSASPATFKKVCREFEIISKRSLYQPKNLKYDKKKHESKSMFHVTRFKEASGLKRDLINTLKNQR